MFAEKYLKKIKALIFPYLAKNAQVFIYGSALTDKRFRDIDIGILDNNLSAKTLREIKESLEESNLPYKIDVVDFLQVDPVFKEKVFQTKILWLT